MIWAVRGLVLGALILVGGLALAAAQQQQPVSQPVSAPTAPAPPTEPRRSGPLAQGESYQRQFALPGEYPYVCTVHPEMRGFVEVQP